MGVAWQGVVRDDRVLACTRDLSLFVVPFLLVAFVIAYLFPEHTPRLWAWTIQATMTSMVLASAYLGGAYFFVRVVRVQHWHEVPTGVLALATGVVMFLAPDSVIPLWPWPLTPLSCRVVGATLCLGGAGAGVWFDPRWTSVRLMLQVEVLMLVLMLVAAVRAHGEMIASHALAWPLLVGTLAVLAGSAYLGASHERGAEGWGSDQVSEVGRDVDRVLLEEAQRDDLQRALVGRRQEHRRRDVVVVGLQPSRCHHAPAVPGVQAGEAELGHRRLQVVADGTLVEQEVLGHHGAHRMEPDVLLAARAAAVAVEAGQRLGAAGFDRTAENVALGPGRRHGSIMPGGAPHTREAQPRSHGAWSSIFE